METIAPVVERLVDRKQVGSFRYKNAVILKCSFIESPQKSVAHAFPDHFVRKSDPEKIPSIKTASPVSPPSLVYSKRKFFCQRHLRSLGKKTVGGRRRGIGVSHFFLLPILSLEAATELIKNSWRRRGKRGDSFDLFSMEKEKEKSIFFVSKRGSMTPLYTH